MLRLYHNKNFRVTNAFYTYLQPGNIVSKKISFLACLAIGLFSSTSQAMETGRTLMHFGLSTYDEVPKIHPRTREQHQILFDIIHSAPYYYTADTCGRTLDMQKFNTACQAINDFNNGPKGKSFLEILIDACIQTPQAYRVLLQKGANLFKKNQKGLTPREQIKQRKEFLRERRNDHFNNPKGDYFDNPTGDVKKVQRKCDLFQSELDQWEDVEKVLVQAEQEQLRNESATATSEAKTADVVQVTSDEINKRILQLAPETKIILALHNDHFLALQQNGYSLIINSDASRILKIIAQEDSKKLVSQQRATLFDKTSTETKTLTRQQPVATATQADAERGHVPKTVLLQVADRIFELAPHTVEIGEQQINGRWLARQEDGETFYFSEDDTSIVHQTDAQGRVISELARLANQFNRLTDQFHEARRRQREDEKVDAQILRWEQKQATEAKRPAVTIALSAEIQERIFIQAPDTIEVAIRFSQSGMEWCALQANGSRRYFNVDATGEYDPD